MAIPMKEKTWREEGLAMAIKLVSASGRENTIHIRLALCLIFILSLFLQFPGTASGQHEGHVHPSEPSEDIGIDEKLGETVPLDLTFRDENGAVVSLKQLVNKPTILSLVYYTCPNVCPRIMSSTAQVLAQLELEPGKEFSVVTVSFDEFDNPAVALQKKRNYVKSIQKPFPDQAWTFLTGDHDSIMKLTDAVGFRFKRVGEAFEHPATLIVLSEDGKIIRYLYGLTYLPFDVKMAITEASEGRIGPTVRRMLLLCFSYDPEGRTYVFNILKVAGIVVLFLAMIFLAILLVKGYMAKRDVRE
jgi:protein SCO1/2